MRNSKGLKSLFSRVALPTIWRFAFSDAKLSFLDSYLHNLDRKGRQETVAMDRIGMKVEFLSQSDWKTGG
jgi:hypothetical protein